jgi:hypothetical protein
MPADTNNPRSPAAVLVAEQVISAPPDMLDDALVDDLTREFQDALRDILPMFDGNEIKSAGESLVVQFPGALAAVQCALEIRRTLSERNEKKSEQRQFLARVGIHLADAGYRENLPGDDTVSGAVRAGAQAEAGGLCITRGVLNEVEHKIPEKFLPVEMSDTTAGLGAVAFYKLQIEPSAEDLKTAAVSRMQLVWLVLGVLALNVILFWVFGKNQKTSTPPATHAPPALSLPATNASQTAPLH